MRRATAWLLLLAGGALVTAAGWGRASASSPRIFTVVQAGDASTLDPAYEGFNAGTASQRAIYEGLFEFDSRMRPVPLLARSWSVSPDGLTYTFRLQQGVTFHDGTPFDAQAAKLNFDRIRDPQKNPRYALYEMIKEARAVRPDTVEVVLARPYSAFIQNLAHQAAMMVSPAAIAKYGVPGLATHAVGTGPFTFGSRRRGDTLVVRRNSAYWQHGRPAVDGIVFRSVPDATQRLAMLKTGEAEFVFPIDPGDVKALSGDPAVRLLKGPSLLVQFVAMNLLHPPFNKREVRLALNYAINKQALISTLYHGYALEMHSFASPLLPGYRAVGTYPFDPDRARSLLTQAGYAQGFTATLWVSTVTFQQRLAVFLQQQFAQIGVRVNIVPMESGTLFALLNKGPDDNTMQLRIGGYSPSNGSIYWQFHVTLSRAAWPPAGLLNFSFYNSPDMERALDAALNTETPGQQNADYARAQQIVFDDAAVIWLATPTNIAGQGAGVVGAYVVPDQTLAMQKAQIP